MLLMLGGVASVADYRSAVVIYAPPDRTITALDAKTGKVRWTMPTGAGSSSSGPKVIDGKVIEMNRAAEAILQMEDGLRIPMGSFARGGSLRPRDWPS